MFRQINDELEELLVTNPLSDLIEDLAEIGENVGFDLSFEWRIKSVASISDSMSAADSCEKSISSVRDLVGLRFWIGCESLRDYPPKMLSLLRSITSQSRHRHLISHLRMIRMDDHPHQKVTVYFRINNVNAEVQIKNGFVRSAISRTVYPMWQSHVKKRFESEGIPFYFDDKSRTQLWNLVCNARENEQLMFPIESASCSCGKVCRMRLDSASIDVEAIESEFEHIARSIGRDVIFA